MLKERFAAREHQGETLSRSGHLRHKFVPVAKEAGFCDAYERCAILLRREHPFHYGGTILSWPFDDNAAST